MFLQYTLQTTLITRTFIAVRSSYSNNIGKRKKLLIYYNYLSCHKLYKLTGERNTVEDTMFIKNLSRLSQPCASHVSIGETNNDTLRKVPENFMIELLFI